MLQPQSVGVFRGRSLLLILWWNCIYSLWLICCISNYCEFKFGMNLRIVISIFIENIFRSHLVVFLSTLEGFLRKIWCFCGCVSIGACWNFCFHIYCYCLVVICREGKFSTYHKLTRHTTKSTKYSQLQSATYCC